MTAAADVIQARPEGLYCPPGDFYIDPQLPVAKAVITHAHGDHALVGSSAYVATEASLPILKQRLPNARVTGMPYDTTFSMGAARVSLHPAGHILGSAQVRIEVDGPADSRVWVVSGDYKRASDPTCAPFAVQPCDVFVTEATFAAPIYRWDAGEVVAREILAWWRHCAAAGKTALLFCYVLGKAQRILAELQRLQDAGEPVPKDPVLVHGALVATTQIYRDAGVRMLPTEHIQPGDKSNALAGRLVLAPPYSHRSLWMKRFRSFETALASGWMRVRGVQRQRGHDRGFVLSDHADWRALTETVLQTGARRVLVMHGREDILIRWLTERGIEADALGNAGQMEQDD